MQLRLYRACGLGGKHLHASAHYRRQHCNSEEHDAQAAYPLGHSAPEEYAVGQMLHIVEDGRTRGGESRHCLEIGIGDIGYKAAYQEGEHTENTEHYPCSRHHEISVTSRKVVVGISSHKPGYQSAKCGEQSGGKERERVILAVPQRHGKAY